MTKNRDAKMSARELAASTGLSFIEAQRMLRAGNGAGGGNGDRGVGGHDWIPEPEFRPSAMAERHVRYLLRHLPSGRFPLGLKIVDASGSAPFGLSDVEVEDLETDYADADLQEIRDDTTAFVLVDVSAHGRLVGWLNARDAAELVSSGEFVERDRVEGTVQVASNYQVWLVASLQVHVEINSHAEMDDTMVLVVTDEPA